MSLPPTALACALALIAIPQAKPLATSAPAMPVSPVKPGSPVRPLQPVKPLPPSVPPRPSKACRGAPLLRVSPKANAGPRGALKTIAAAANQARARNYCRLRVQLESGTHPDTSTVNLDRPTEIEGPARGRAKIRTSLRVRDGVSLEIDKVTFDRPRGPAIDVRHSKAKTSLARVTIQHAPQYAIFIEGGELSARGLVVTHTTPHTDLLSGTGLRIGARTVADIDGLIAQSNGAHDVVVAGRGTRVTAKNLHLTGTKHHPRAVLEAKRNPSFWKAGALMVGDGAKLLADRVHITRVDMAAAVVYGGAKARLRRLHVRDVRSASATDGKDYGGIGVASISGAIVELEDFSVRQAAQAGLRIDRAYTTARSGRVTGCQIGVSMDLDGLRSDYGIRCLEERVRYVGNTVNLDSTQAFTPTVPGQAPRPAWCPRVN